MLSQPVFPTCRTKSRWSALLTTCWPYRPWPASGVVRHEGACHSRARASSRCIGRRAGPSRRLPMNRSVALGSIAVLAAALAATLVARSDQEAGIEAGLSAVLAVIVGLAYVGSGLVA